MKSRQWLTPHQICALLHHDPESLIALCNDRHYREYWKRVGHKKRLLLEPTNPLKAVQRQLLRKLLVPLDTHAACFCRVGAGLHRATRLHVGHPCLLHLDIKNFFPSVSFEKVRESFKSLGLPAAGSTLLARLVTIRNQLPQGAPSSVSVGNLVLRKLDASLQGLSNSNGFSYTRYVDDIALSGGPRLERFQGTVGRIIVECGWEVNSKGGFFGSNDPHRLLGLIINEKLDVDDTYFDGIAFTVRMVAKGELHLTSSQLSRLMAQIRWIESINASRGLKLKRQMMAVQT